MIYLDHNATTPLDPAALEAMLPFLRDTWGNPSSVHLAGQHARHAVDDARDRLAALVGCAPKELVFTSGGTEADALALRGAFEAARDRRRRVVVSRVEHPAVLETARTLARDGADVVEIGVDGSGALREDELEHAIDDTTALVSIMSANNETGLIYPIDRISKICRRRGALLHTDAVQAFGRIPVKLEGVDLLSVSAHKVHGPKGIGALYVRRNTRLFAQQVGGHQERGRRAGTENVAGIVGFAEAAARTFAGLESTAARVGELTRRLEERITQEVPDVLVPGGGGTRLWNTTTICFGGLEGEAILMALDLAGICASSGSACSAGSMEPSHVLQAMGVPRAYLHGAVRFSLGRDTSDAEVSHVVARLRGIVADLRAAASA